MIDTQHFEFRLKEWLPVASGTSYDGKTTSRACFKTEGELYRYNEDKLAIEHKGKSYDLSTLPIEISLVFGNELIEGQNRAYFFPPRKSIEDGDEVAYLAIEVANNASFDLGAMKSLNKLDVSLSGMTFRKKGYTGSEAVISDRIIHVETYSLYFDELGVVEEKVDTKISDLQK